RVICEQEPRLPSAAVTRRRGGAATLAEGTPVTASPRHRAAASQLKGDLDNIVLKALRKEPARRYASVEQFAEDIRRHLDGLPVMARKPSWSYHTAKFMKRHRAAMAVAATMAVTLMAGVLLIIREARIA